MCSDWIDVEPIAIVSGNNFSSDSISNRFNFLLSSGHVPSADYCLDIIMADLANRVLFMLICILNAMIVDFMTRRLLQRRIYRHFIQRMPNEHVLNRAQRHLEYNYIIESMDISIRHLRFFTIYFSYKTTFFKKNILKLSLGRFLWNLFQDTQNSFNFICLSDSNFLSAWFLFSGDLNTNVDYSNFILVKIYSKFDVRKYKLSLNHKKLKVI